ncbi:hypothetical protein RUM43_009423 [Polyplax serrata]|uniref:Rab-GAP TBC domain-containing protein n=1 Tax=Polyplax serrata TaxID=468196 RepID=A0AAN8NZL4_POLSC
MSNSGVYGYNREAVRVKVKKCEHGLNPEYRKFSIDPRITSFEVLQSIIAKAFDIKGDFAINYRAIDDYAQEALLPLLSDWDLDAAVLSASEPCLVLHVEIKSSEEKSEILENWAPVEIKPEQPPQRDVFGTIEIPRNQITETKIQNRLPGLIMNRMEKTLNIFQRAFNLGEDQVSSSNVQSSQRTPLSDDEFRKFLGPMGQLSQMKELRLAIYYGGVEPGLRKVVWKHILNVYPHGMSAKERIAYMKRKANEYEMLKTTWHDMVQKGQVSEELTYVTSMVRKDVLRTDRHHKFYAGSDDNQNIASLFNILTTYALNHPSVSYCQGMSDLASPLLVTMVDEAHAYICFCALMSRLKPNFMLDGITMTLKFQHLTEGLTYYDPDFYAYLKLHQAEDLLFCYRWLLLEMKREFAFDDALHMLEVLWSSLPAVPPETELPLYETKFPSHPSGLTPPPFSPLIKTPRESPYTKVCALRRQSSLMSLSSVASRRVLPNPHRQNQSLDETILVRQNQLRKQRKVKPFSSLDDNCVQLLTTISTSTSRSISPMNVRSESDVLGLMKKRVSTMKLTNRNGGLSSSTGNLLETSNKRNLAKRLAQDKSFTSLTETGNDENEVSKVNNKVHKGRVVKNLNEFLNFTTLSKSRILTDKFKSQCRSISEGEVNSGPEITLTKSPFDEVGSDAIHSDMENISELQTSTSPSYTSSTSPHIFENHGSDDISPDDSNEYYPMTTSMTKELALELDNLDRKVFGASYGQRKEVLVSEGEGDAPKVEEPGKKGEEGDVFVWENPLKCVPTPDEQAELEFDGNSDSKTTETELANSNPPKEANEEGDGWKKSETLPNVKAGSSAGNQNGTCEEATEVPGLLTRSANSIRVSGLLNSLRSGTAVSQILRSPGRSQSTVQLPKPEEFGGGNPFLMFLCLTLLRQHRDYIIRSAMDYNEMAMHFDKMVRKHNVTKVLDEARQLFASYLKQHSLSDLDVSKQSVRT